MLLIEVVVGILAEIASNGANERAWDNVGAASYMYGVGQSRKNS